jgi:TolA-binding protein
MEEKLHAEQEYRRDMEDLLQSERERLASTTEQLSKEMHSRFILEQNLLMQNEDLNSTKLQLFEVKKQIYVPPGTESSSAGEGGPVGVVDIDTSSVDGDKPLDRELTDEEILQSIVDPKVRSQIDASQFLFDRAMELYETGWYRKAQPLFQECFLVRDKHVRRVAMTGDTLFYLAKNLSASLDFDLAQNHLRDYLNLRDRYVILYCII